MPSKRRTTTVVLFALALPFAATANAPAATLEQQGDQLVYLAAPGEQNFAFFTKTADDVLEVKDLGASISLKPGTPCAPTAQDGVLHCDVPANGVKASGGDKDDVLGADGVPASLAGGDGNDTLQGGEHKDGLTGGNGDDVLHGAWFAGPDDTVTSGDQLTGGTGDDDLYGSPLNDTLLGGIGADELDADAGNDTLASGPGADVLRGGDGKDLADYSSSTDPVFVYGPSGWGRDGTESETYVSIESWTGGQAHDTLRGNDGPNTLKGGPSEDTLFGDGGDDTLRGEAGSDTLEGGAGADDLEGGAGYDSASYAYRQNPVTLSNDGVRNDGERDERDLLRDNFEFLVGGFGADVLIGSDGFESMQGAGSGDVLRGNGGDDHLYGDYEQDEFSGPDVLDGGPGGDVLRGGPHRDTVTYASRTAPVTAKNDGTATSGEAGELDLIATDIEDLEGGKGNDRLTGSAGANLLAGGAGDDLLDGGFGPDAFRGGSGTDKVTYATRTTPVQAAIDGRSTSGGSEDGEGDAKDEVATDVEGLVGGSANDVLTGSKLGNWLQGGAGDDTLVGLAGPDRFRGDAGADTLKAAGDATKDEVVCGQGAPDRAEADQGLDTVGADCELRS